MSQFNVKVTFVLPKMVEGEYSTHVNLLSPGSLKRGSTIVGSNASTRLLKVDTLPNVTFRTGTSCVRLRACLLGANEWRILIIDDYLSGVHRALSRLINFESEIISINSIFWER